MFGRFSMRFIRSVFLRVGLIVALITVFFGVSISAVGQSEWVVHSFNGTNGSQPMGNLVADSAGNLYGTAFEGGADNWGVVYELVRPVPPKTLWTGTVLYNFTGGADGRDPVAGVVFDKAGNLYGSTSRGGPPATELSLNYSLHLPLEENGAKLSCTLFSQPTAMGRRLSASWSGIALATSTAQRNTVALTKGVVASTASIRVAAPYFSFRRQPWRAGPG
jgi:hypothetical protein